MRLYFIKERLVASNQLLIFQHHGQVMPKADNLKPQQVDNANKYISKISFMKVEYSTNI